MPEISEIFESQRKFLQNGTLACRTSLSTENGIMKLKVRGVQAKTSFKDGLGCILKSFGCKGDVDFGLLPMYYDYEVFPVRFV